MQIVYRYRVKSLTGLLDRQSQAVSFVWNFCNDTQKHALKWGKKWPSGFDLNVLTTGSSQQRGLHSGTVNAVCEQYAKSRNQHRRPYLRYRGRKSLPWVPLKGRNLKRQGEDFRFAGHTSRVFHSRALPEGKIRDSTNFSCDRCGNWYLNIVIDTPEDTARTGHRAVGIDLGLKNLVTLSTGERIENPRHWAALESALAVAQRAHKLRQARNVHARICNARRDFLHKLSSRIVREFDEIAVGNITPAGLTRTRMAKSVLDASWSAFRQMLAYKAVKHGARYTEVEERFSTQVCSACGAMPPSRPKGMVKRASAAPPPRCCRSPCRCGSRHSGRARAASRATTRPQSHPGCPEFHCPASHPGHRVAPAPPRAPRLSRRSTGRRCTRAARRPTPTDAAAGSTCRE
ncbi:MAG: RNA-guided endonuclease InsQ/TnpB family protein [Steroidobacteraceae bacterium]